VTNKKKFIFVFLWLFVTFYDKNRDKFTRMNYHKAMKAINNIKNHLKKIPEGESFSANSLRHLASTDNLRQILNRLVKAGEIKRIARGVFVKPIHIPNIGEAFPTIGEITEMIAKSSGEKIAIHGAEAARQLRLTTQVPMRLVLYTSGNTREIKIKNQSVLLKHVSPSKLIAPGTIAGTVISALLYLGHEQISKETIQKIKDLLGFQEFESVLEHIGQMPAWMANAFYNFQKGAYNG
jgi:hypothetical protein